MGKGTSSLSEDHMKRRTFISCGIASALIFPRLIKANSLVILGPATSHAVKPILQHEHLDFGTIIRIIGVGGAGGNLVNHMIGTGIRGAEFLVLDTDALALQRSLASCRIQLGRTGHGTEGSPEAARDAALEARDLIADGLTQ